MLFFRRFIAFLLSLCVLSASSQTTEPAYANMQRSIGGIIQSATQSMGYNPSDPRTYSTLRGVGQATAASAAAVGTGLLVGTAPAWASILAVAAVSGAVSYGVGITLDAVVKWAFGSGSNPVSVTAPSGNSSGAPVPNAGVASWINQNSSSFVSGTTYFVAPLNATYNPCFIPGGVQPGYYYVQSSTANANGCYQYYGSFYSSTLSQAANSACPAGSTALTWASCSGSTATTPVTTANQTISQAVDLLTTVQKQQAVSYDAMALIINQMWKQAAAQPGYAGVPYSVTNPVTAAQVQTWAQANPSSYPTVDALTSPVTSSTGFAPSTTTSTGTVVSPATTETASTATNPSTQTSQINLGPDPNIGSPTLEGTPTAQMILAPLITLFPDLKAYNVPGHTGVCPKPTFEVFGTAILMDQHCTIFEQQRSALYAAGLLAFTLAALFIVLSA